MDFETLKKELPTLQENVELKDYTTYKIGGPAKYFLIVASPVQTSLALALAKKHGMAFLVLGGGSNLLVSDKGFDGLVVKVDIKDDISRDGNTITAGAGVSMKDLVDFCVSNELAGLEWAGGLPGTLGGAIRGNAGAFGGETKDSILEVGALDDNLQLKKLSNKECQFGYRTSIFKTQNWIVLSAKLQLKKGDKNEIVKVAQARADFRHERHPLEYGNSGSVFKNMPLSEFSEYWQKNLVHVVKRDPFDVVPTAYLISEAGLKGTTIGGGQISAKHPNFIVNLGNAKAEDILTLIEITKTKVKEKFGVQLEVEVQLVNLP